MFLQTRRFPSLFLRFRKFSATIAFPMGYALFFPLKKKFPRFSGSSNGSIMMYVYESQEASQKRVFEIPMGQMDLFPKGSMDVVEIVALDHYNLAWIVRDNIFDRLCVADVFNFVKFFLQHIEQRFSNGCSSATRIDQE